MAKKLINDPEFIDEVLNEAEVLHVAFADGEVPYPVPLNFVRLDGRLYFHSSPKGHKMELVRREARLGFVAYVVDGRTFATRPCGCGFKYRSVQGTGRAREVTDLAAKARVLNALVQKYAGDRAFEPLTLSDLHDLDRTDVVEIELDSVMGKQNA